MKHSKFNLSHTHSTTLDAGKLIPFFLQTTLPGDRFRIGLRNFVRCQPMVAPLMHQVYLYTQYWYVPYRILWDKWEDFITGGENLDLSPAFPQVQSPKGGWTVGSLADYFGFPVKQEGLRVSAMPFRAYNEIWNTRYRDQDLQGEVQVVYTDGLDTRTKQDILSPSWKRDYFTTARPWTQRGANISVPVYTSLESPTSIVKRTFKGSFTCLSNSFVNNPSDPDFERIAISLRHAKIVFNGISWNAGSDASVGVVSNELIVPVGTYPAFDTEQDFENRRYNENFKKLYQLCSSMLLNNIYLGPGFNNLPSSRVSLFLKDPSQINNSVNLSDFFNTAKTTGWTFEPAGFATYDVGVKLYSSDLSFQYNFTFENFPILCFYTIVGAEFVPSFGQNTQIKITAICDQGGGFGDRQRFTTNVDSFEPNPNNFGICTLFNHNTEFFNYVRSSEGGVISIRDLRASAALQRYAERSLKYGNRYEEFIQREFGVKPRDSRIQRPEYLGGGRGILNISEVLQTAEGTDTSVGTMRGHGVASIAQRPIRFKSPEHGLIIGLLSIRPKAVYTQGIEREFLKVSRLDFFTRELANIGMQEVLTQELYATAENTGDIFGYSDRYQEYRFHKPLVTGEFRDTLNYWNMARIFNNAPSLNDEFINMEYSTEVYKRPFAVQDRSFHSFLIMLENIVQAYRPIPKRSKDILK